MNIYLNDLCIYDVNVLLRTSEVDQMKIGSRKFIGAVLIVFLTLLNLTSVCNAESHKTTLDGSNLEYDFNKNNSYEHLIETDYDYEAAIEQDHHNQELINLKPVYKISNEGSLERLTNEISEIEAEETDMLVNVTGTYPRGKNSKGTILYTTDTVHKVAKVVGHAAIVYDNNTKNSKVIEATSKGVVKGNNSWDNKKHCRAAAVSSLSVAKRANVADKCATWLGKPYNWNFSDVKTRNSFYCSQLVWAGYMDLYGVNLDDNHNDPTQKNFLIVYPSELIASKKTSIIYKKG